MSEFSYSTLMPPMCLLLATPLGALIALRWRGAGLAIVFVSSLLLYGFCTQFVADRLIVAVESEVPLASAAELAGAQAIAVLSGDVYHGKLGGVPDDVGLLTLDRLRLAATLYRAHPLPILVTGAIAGSNAETAAVLMARTLDRDYGIKTDWIENQADNTFENGADSAAIFKANHISRVIVVTQAWHMARALWSFRHAGLVAIPAPAERSYLGSGIDWHDFEPDYDSFSRSFFALHEMLGLVYYRYRYGPIKAAD
ncbi:MAG TPA: YdcF family protein [Stellaceae bacterium]|nr:YdcF family protein [Stellaceae bacterium]